MILRNVLKCLSDTRTFSDISPRMQRFNERELKRWFSSSENLETSKDKQIYLKLEPNHENALKTYK